MLNRKLLIALFGIIALFIIIIILILLTNSRPAAVQTLSKQPEKIDISSQPPESSPVSNQYYYPMARYSDRLTVRWYGKRVTSADREAIACGVSYEGIHTADDLEVSESEIDQEVPIYAIAAGTILQVGATDGYGGLIVANHTLNGQPVTVYYGHIDLGQTDLKIGDRVEAGEQISVLGGHCSPASGNERKHLHFGILNDTDIDVRGYVSSENDLREWIDPKKALESLMAGEPPAD